tara:strand:- start:41884 stop:42618 length:735 start_codon:yes stop_codon:yes gene_type:complete
MKVSGAKVGLHIGFGGEFYTLWSVGSADEDGEQQASFWKNISKDLEEAKALYPKAEVSGLKGDSWVMSSGQKFEPRDHSLPEFQCGKYEGDLISECKDLKYLEWYANEFYCPPAEVVLLANGYVDDDGTIMTQERFDGIQTHDKAMNALVGENIKVKVMSNVNEHGGIKVLTEEIDALGRYQWGHEIYVSREIYMDCPERFYNGYSYRVLAGMRSMKGDAVVTIERTSMFGFDDVLTITKFDKA